MSDVAVDTNSEITTKDLKEKKEVVEETKNGRDTPANEEKGEQEADNVVEEEGGKEEKEEGDGVKEDGDEDEEAETVMGKRTAEDDDVDTKEQKTDEDD
ncbi:PREDICTED: prothymosin alpha-like [Chrysochloris asiatica]|uniref:Prothymosin alpha n=1 Tax=Chrysochloris asiatica TaxID=185453 RepID=A0A9B0WWW3_CHRAS|nr:PREDICTED: prothymosin alpha-like [Chrysochloris asiatica]